MRPVAFRELPCQGRQPCSCHPLSHLVSRGDLYSHWLVLTCSALHPRPYRGADLEGCQYRHPLFDRVSPVVVGGDYITTESGTGLVHTAPGHGQEDYQVGRWQGGWVVVGWWYGGGRWGPDREPHDCACASLW